MNDTFEDLLAVFTLGVSLTMFVRFLLLALERRRKGDPYETLLCYGLAAFALCVGALATLLGIRHE